MKRTSTFLLAACVAAVLAGCNLPGAPPVTPTPSDATMEAGMDLITIETEGTLTAQAPSPLSTPTPEPIVSPTLAPTEEPTTAPSPESTPVPLQTPAEQPTTPPTSAPVGAEMTYVVQPGDTLFRIARRYGMRFEDLAYYNNIVNPHRIYVGQVIRIPDGATPPTAGEVLYTVQPGDNLYRIALRYSLNYMYLASYNGIVNPHRINVGQVIRIPVQ